VVLALILWLLMGLCSGLLAAQKGRSAAGFGLLGVVLGPIGILCAAAATPANGGPAADLRECPHCAESIKRAAKVCRFCGRDVEPLIKLREVDPDAGMTMSERVMRR
jgi:hypothetical protein